MAEVSLKVEALSDDGFTQQTVQTITENCRTLWLQDLRFEEYGLTCSPKTIPLGMLGSRQNPCCSEPPSDGKRSVSGCQEMSAGGSYCTGAATFPVAAGLHPEIETSAHSGTHPSSFH